VPFQWAGAESSNGRVEVVIADTGQGVAVDKLERLFDPFDRLGAEQTCTGVRCSNS
jgi:signal transduction histidine kinase